MRLISEAEAAVLQTRLAEGLSVLDEHGNEVAVPPSRRRRPSGQVPSVATLMARKIHMPNPSPAEVQIVGDVVARPDREKRLAAEAEQRAAEAARRKAAEERILAGLRERAEARQALPCYPDDPSHNPAGSDVAAAAACQAVKGYRECRLGDLSPRDCARARLDIAYQETAKRLSVGGVPFDFADRVLASLPGHRVDGKRVAPVALEARPALLAVRAWLEGTGEVVAEAGMVEPFARGQVLLALGGAKRCGKSLAGGWAVARTGGRFVTATDIANVPFEAWEARLAELMEVVLLVIDELGFEPLTPTSKSRLFDVVAKRHANRRKVLLTSNLPRYLDREREPERRPEETFAGRYDERLDARLRESGRWLRLLPWNGGER